MSAEPLDRTATLQPRTAARAVEPSLEQEARDLGEEPETLLPVDDPDRYEQICEHARGGLGRIVRAVDRRLGRTVAVKELLRRDDAHEARFVREALITARLEHPGIVPVHEAGRWPNGDPYYVMKLVEGRTLKELMASTQDSPRERLALLQHVIAVADAVGYAHSEGVVHRDVKPSNVIVGAFGETIVVDWGLARDCKHDVAEPSHELLAEGSGISTISGKVVGTPAYMAPEQARGELVDARADVYAIGAVLYELLAGKAPHHDQTPKAMLDRVIAGPPPPLSIIAPVVPTELADIIGKAMSRDPQDRYANATLLAEDLRAFQTGKLVSAHAYTPWQLIRKRMQAHRGVVAVALASAVALGAVGVESVRRVVAERDIAEGERSRAESAAQAAENKQRELVLLQAQTSLRKDPTAALAWLKQYAISPNDHDQVVDVIDEALALGTATHVVRSGSGMLDAQFTHDGTAVIECGHDGAIRRYDLANHAFTVIGHTASEPQSIAISPDGKWAVVGAKMGEVIAFPLVKGVDQKTLTTGGKAVNRIEFVDPQMMLVHRQDNRVVEALNFKGDLTRIGPIDSEHSAVATRDLSKRVATTGPNEISAGDRVIAHIDRAIEQLFISPDGETVFIHDGKTLFSVPYAGGAVTKVTDWPTSLDNMEWTQDLARVALIGKQPEILIVDMPSHGIRTLRGHTDSIYDVAFSHDGTMLISASDDATARIWNLVDGNSQVLRGHDDDVIHVHFSPDEQRVVTTSLDGSFRVWPIDQSAALSMREGAMIQEMRVVGTKAQVQTATSSAVWDLEHGTREQLVSWDKGLARGVPSPDGQSVMVPVKLNMELRFRDGRAPITFPGHKKEIRAYKWSADSKLFYSASYDNTLRRLDVTTGESKVLISGTAQIPGFDISKDGRVVAQLDRNRVVMIHPDGTSEMLGKWCTNMFEFEPVRDLLFVARCDHGLLVIDGKSTVELDTDTASPERVVVSPDGKRFAAPMTDRTIHVWDEHGKTLGVLRGHVDLVYDIAFSPDGTELASASYDKTVRVWQLGTQHHRVLRGSSAPFIRIAWPRADQLVTAAFDGTIRVWPVPSVAMPSQTEVARRLDQATTAVIDEKNRATTVGS